jgi:hypothetical protein
VVRLLLEPSIYFNKITSGYQDDDFEELKARFALYLDDGSVAKKW